MLEGMQIGLREVPMTEVDGRVFSSLYKDRVEKGVCHGLQQLGFLVIVDLMVGICVLAGSGKSCRSNLRSVVKQANTIHLYT